MGLALEPEGCMTPLFAACREDQIVNAHWCPPFGRPDAEVKGYGLLSHIAGEFPCCPEFGPGSAVRGVSIPAHGWTANEEWTVETLDIDNEAGAATCVLSLESPSPELPLSWTRRVSVLAGQSAYYSVLTIRNRGTDELSVNLGHHNVVGAPFLEPGCRISLSADGFMVPPEGTEFDATGRLAMGAEFDGLGRAPLRNGGMVDLSYVPGIVGHTDFVTGAISPDLTLGWSCVANPRRGLAYLSSSQAPKACRKARSPSPSTTCGCNTAVGDSSPGQRGTVPRIRPSAWARRTRRGPSRTAWHTPSNGPRFSAGPRPSRSPRRASGDSATGQPSPG